MFSNKISCSDQRILLDKMIILNFKKCKKYVLKKIRWADHLLSACTWFDFSIYDFFLLKKNIKKYVEKYFKNYMKKNIFWKKKLIRSAYFIRSDKIKKKYVSKIQMIRSADFIRSNDHLFYCFILLLSFEEMKKLKILYIIHASIL